ncbi:putative succinate dehydrogenase (quinone) [Helianthus anomalus]
MLQYFNQLYFVLRVIVEPISQQPLLILAQEMGMLWLHVQSFLLRNGDERFMERYTPTMKDLASRDALRFMTMEICEGCDVAMFNNQLQLNYQRLLFIFPC